MSKKIILIIIAILFLIVGTGGYLIYKSVYTQNAVSVTSSNPLPTKNLITLTSNGFTPNSLTIKAGETVTWVNKSGSTATVDSNPHPIHTDYSPLNLGNFADGQVLSLSFPKPGKYSYHNHFNPSQGGTIIVE